MKKNILYKIIAVLLISVMVFTCASCKKKSIDDNGDGGGGKDESVDFGRGYNYTKQSDSLMQFYSSDAELDAFLNEYMERHLRYSDKAIGKLKIGQGNSIWKEWESKSVMFMNIAELGYDPKSTIKSWVDGIYQDAFGYIWMDNGTGSNSWGQCWEFPSSKQSQGHSNSYSFNSGKENWSAISDTGIAGSVNAYGSTASKPIYDGFYKVTSKEKPMKTVTYETDKNVTFMCDTYHAPFVELGLNLTDLDSQGSTSQVEDIYLYFKTEGDKEFSDTKKVKYSNFSSTYYGDAFPSTASVVFPMYENYEWGTNNTVTGMKIEIKFKNGIRGEVGLNYINLDYDARQINNNGVFIVAAANYFEYTQDKEFLAKNIDKIRKAMQFYLTYCNGESGLVSTENFLGHDGSTNEDFINRAPGTTTGTGSGIGDGYWDCLSYPMVSSYCNNLYYLSLQKMLYLEKMASEAKINTAKTVSVKTANMLETETYDKTTATLNELLTLSKTKYNENFWDSKLGRYHLGINANGDKVDYGFTMFNQEAIEYGLASSEQAIKIMEWIDGDRTITTDSAKGKNIYYYSFAPRWTTKKNDYQFWWQFNGANGTYYKWGNQIQNGGVAIHQAYYDLTATAAANGIDKSFAKLKNINKWYDTVKSLGKGTGDKFYSSYYGGYLTGNTYRLQGTLGAGAIGLDNEFLEAAILYTSVPDIFFGLGSTNYNVLNITPNIPEGLTYWKMENLTFSNLIYDLSIGKNFVQINSVRGDSVGKYVNVTLNKPATTFEVRQHDKVLVEGKDYVIDGEKVIIKAAFINGRIQIIEK